MQHDEVNRHENKSDLAVLGLAACHAKLEMDAPASHSHIDHECSPLRQATSCQHETAPWQCRKKFYIFFLWHKHMVLHIFVTLKILTHKCFYTLQMKRRTAFCFFEPGPRRSYTVVVHATNDNVISHVTTWLLSMRPMSPHFSICAVCHPCPVVMQLY